MLVVRVGPDTSTQTPSRTSKGPLTRPAREPVCAWSGVPTRSVTSASARRSRRDGDESFGELTRLAQHVEIWFYADARRFTYGTFEANVTGMLQASSPRSIGA